MVAASSSANCHLPVRHTTAVITKQTRSLVPSFSLDRNQHFKIHKCVARGSYNANLSQNKTK